MRCGRSECGFKSRRSPRINMKKVNRKMKEKAFNMLRKTANPSERIDKFGKVIDFHSYGQKTEKGWLIVDSEAVSIGTVRIDKSWEK